MGRRSRLAIDVSSDLVFMDEALENEFRAYHTEEQVNIYVAPT